MVLMRRLLRVKGDVVCTMLLLLLFCLLFYARQVTTLPRNQSYGARDILRIFHLLPRSGAVIFWVGQTCLEAGGQQLYQLQQDSAGSQWIQSEGG